MSVDIQTHTCTHPLSESKAISITLTLSVWNTSMESLWLDVISEVGTLTISLKDYETREIKITFKIITCTCMCNLTVFLLLNKLSFINKIHVHAHNVQVHVQVYEEKWIAMIAFLALLSMFTMVPLLYHNWLSHAWTYYN